MPLASNAVEEEQNLLVESIYPSYSSSITSENSFNQEIQQITLKRLNSIREKNQALVETTRNNLEQQYERSKNSPYEFAFSLMETQLKKQETKIEATPKEIQEVISKFSSSSKPNHQLVMSVLKDGIKNNTQDDNLKLSAKMIEHEIKTMRFKQNCCSCTQKTLCCILLCPLCCPMALCFVCEDDDDKNPCFPTAAQFYKKDDECTFINPTPAVMK